MSENVRIWERKVGKHRTEDDENKWQADIFWGNEDHHGIGKTPSEALVRAATHWASRSRSISAACAALQEVADLSTGYDDLVDALKIARAALEEKRVR